MMSYLTVYNIYSFHDLSVNFPLKFYQTCRIEASNWTIEELSNMCGADMKKNHIEISLCICLTIYGTVPINVIPDIKKILPKFFKDF